MEKNKFTSKDIHRETSVLSKECAKKERNNGIYIYVYYVRKGKLFSPQLAICLDFLNNTSANAQGPVVVIKCT